MSNLVSVHLETVLLLVQNRCTVCAKRTIGSKIILDTLVSVCLETVLALVQDSCTVCAKHSAGSKIILDAPDGTPR
jgi:uncharacterized membrane protein